MTEDKAQKYKIAALVAAIGVAAALPFACDNGSEPKRSEQKSAVAAEPARARSAQTAPRDEMPREPSPQAGEPIRWTKPAAWKEKPNGSPMRKATYQIPRADGDAEDAEMGVFEFGGSTGDNIARWEGQFGGAKAKTSQKNPHGLAANIVEIEGDYTGGGPMMGGAEKKSGWMMLAAIVDVAGGEHYFFKLTGPKKTVAAARKDFDALLDSISKT